jgi:hypothetical protein
VIPATEERRFDKVFCVVVGSELYGESAAVVRRISAKGVWVTTNDVCPSGAIVTVHFHIEGTDDEIVARAEVLSVMLGDGELAAERMVRGMILRFMDFDENLPLSLPGSRVLH